MAQTVRSVRIASGVSGAANTLTVIYTAPAGRTAIVKDWRITGVASGGTVCIFGVQSGPGPVYLAHKANLAFEETLQDQGFVVLEPGHQLAIFSSVAAGLRYWVSGAELDGVAP